MFRPLDIVRCFHNAFRKDMFQIDKSFLANSRENADMESLFDKVRVLGEILDYHAKGEEVAVFPAVDNLKPQVAQAYSIDHRELDNMVNALESLRNAPDALMTVRASAILQSQLRIHLDKEDVHLYPILREGTTDAEQREIGRLMSSKVPQEKFPVFAQWLFPLLELNDQVTIAKSWMAMMPPPVFAMVKQLIKTNTGENWAELIELVPGLFE